MSRLTVWILGDQLLARHPALEHVRGDEVRVLIVENWRRTHRLNYHRQKLTLIFSAMRHYAERLRRDGYTVDYVQTERVGDALRQHASDHPPDKIVTMAASEYRGRLFQRERLAAITGVPVEVLPNTQFLVGIHDPYPDADPDRRYVMENFYRAMRRHFNVFMDGDQPIGGRWNYDHDNRKPLPKSGIPLPDPPAWEPDTITRAVQAEIVERGMGWGEIDGFNYAVTHEQAQAALALFVAERLADFGAYEDAMTRRHRTLFHSVLSPYVNIGLLTPMQMIHAAEAAYHAGTAPVNSVEGFIRQVIGWREYMYWQYWRQMPALLEENAWDAHTPLPGFLWTGETDMNCLSHVLNGLKERAYSHHIERLMLLSNFMTLIGAEPQDAVRWFSAAYIDAYDWVMQPNVVGMGLNADGGKTATKPYIASANYINTMSDYCKPCRYNHKQRTGDDACPFNVLYWNFLIEHETRLKANPRFGKAVLSLRHVPMEERALIQRQARQLIESFS